MFRNKGFRRFLTGEQLESRAMLAGNVTASLSGGRITIRGDAEDNEITITQVDADSYTVTGVATDVNGDALPVDFDGVTAGFNIDLRGGNDILTIEAATDPIAGNVFVRMNSGDDTVSLAASVTGSVN